MNIIDIMIDINNTNDLNVLKNRIKENRVLLEYYQKKIDSLNKDIAYSKLRIAELDKSEDILSL